MKVQLAVCCMFLAVATATPFDVTAFGAVGDGVTGQNICSPFLQTRSIPPHKIATPTYRQHF